MIPYGKQNISQSDIDAVVNVLKSDWITQGPNISRFENKVCEYTSANYAVAVNSATSALHIACLALGLEKGDLVWTSPNSFVASANCALYCGSDIDFVDIDSKSYNLCPDKLEAKLKASSKIPKIVIPVHFSGQSCDMKRIKELSNEYGFAIIEDASHSIGATYSNSKVGSCEYSDITVFSFHPVKIITTGEGGMALTNNKKLCALMEKYRSHGVTKNPNLLINKNSEPWYYEQQALGLNYRITDIQCALGNSQLHRLDEFIDKRHSIAQRYNTLLADLPIIVPEQKANQRSSFHLYVIQVDEKKRLELFTFLRKNDIGVNVHYIPIHTQPYYQQLGFNNGDFPVSEKYYSRVISLPMYPDLTEHEQDFIINKIKEFLCV